MLRRIRWAAIGLLAVVLCVWAVALLLPERVGNVLRTAVSGAAGVVMPGGVAIGGPFTLADTQGKTVTDATYRGRWMLIYFGYTFCPDVCPTELQTIASALDQLGPDASKVAPLFITVDPERDTVAAMADYVKLFDDRLIGLTGSPEQIAAVARAYRVYYARTTPKDSSSYLMDHSSFVYFMGPDGSLRGLFRPGTSPAELAAAMRARMTST